MHTRYRKDRKIFGFFMPLVSQRRIKIQKCTHTNRVPYTSSQETSAHSAHTLPGGEVSDRHRHWACGRTMQSAINLNRCPNRFNCVVSTESSIHSHAVKRWNLKQQPKISLWVYPDMGRKKPYLTACVVLKTILNIHPSHVGYDTSAQVHDTSAVDLENSY